MKRVFCIVLAASAVSLGQERSDDLIPYSRDEIENLINTFLQTYKDMDAPEGDAVSVLADLRQAWRYLESKGDERTREQEKLQKKLVSAISAGLVVRDRPLVGLECVRSLGELGVPDANRDVRRWLENVLDEKWPDQQRMEIGFQSLAWIGAADRESLDLALDCATMEKHKGVAAAAHALRACYEWRKLEPAVRREFFEKILDHLLGFWEGKNQGEAKDKRQYNAVKKEGLRCLEELAGDGSKFANPLEAMEWKKAHDKKTKWTRYTGPRFRPAKTEIDEDAS